MFDHQEIATHWCHPILYYILGLHQNGTDIAQWFENISTAPGDTVSVDDLGSFSKNDIAYYFRKYLLLMQNGYFSRVDVEHYLSGRLTAGDIKASLANTRQITFEVVDYCNLDCAYCTYGKFYQNYDARGKNKFDPRAAKTFLNYLHELLESPLNQSYGKPVYLGFYGGEPLLNMPFIREVVEHAKQMKVQHNRFIFNITTNGVLLDKYTDFLVEHDFMLAVSLDGDEANNSYRRFHDGSESFQRIMGNIKRIKEKYPDYFESRVSFSTVFHNRNSITDIHSFFKNQFGKIPTISTLNPSGLRDSMRETFWKTYANIEASIKEVEDYSLLEKDFFTRLPDISETRSFLDQCSGFVFNEYNDVLVPGEKAMQWERQPTGTCIPFNRKVFITAKGKILPCEQIGHEHGLGTVTENKVNLDFAEIAEKFNGYYDKLKPQCLACANWDSCYQCIFYLDLEKPVPKCSGMLDDKKQAQYLSSRISYLEENRDKYAKVMKEARIE